MYALLARRPVFRGKSLPEMLHKQRFEQPEPLGKYAPDMPDELEQIIAQLLEKDPGQRIPNANILGRRLEAMLHALSLGPETMDAGRSWFFPEPPAAGAPSGAGAAGGAGFQPASSAPPRPLLSADDVPVTQVLGVEAEVAKRPTPPALPTPGARPAASKAGPQPIVVNGAGGQPASGAGGQPAARAPLTASSSCPKRCSTRPRKRSPALGSPGRPGRAAAALLLLGLARDGLCSPLRPTPSTTASPKRPPTSRLARSATPRGTSTTSSTATPATAAPPKSASSNAKSNFTTWKTSSIFGSRGCSARTASSPSSGPTSKPSITSSSTRKSAWPSWKRSSLSTTGRGRKRSRPGNA